MNTARKIIPLTDARPLPFTLERWTQARAHITEAIARTNGTHTEEDVVAMLLAGRAGLWVGRECAAVTEIKDWGHFKEVNVFLAGGSMDGIVAMEPSLETHAVENGCRRIVIDGRKGWERVLPEYGVLSVKISKEVRHG